MLAKAMVAYESMGPAKLPFQRPEEVLGFWFGARKALADQEHLKNRFSWWFGKAPDEFVRVQEKAAPEELESAAVNAKGWGGPGGTLARILLLDQFPRTAYRGTAAAFKYDRAAASLARAAIQDLHLFEPTERIFVTLPLMHSEDLADQDLCVRLLEADPTSNQLAFAEEHRNVIKRFSRFPHRNSALNRESTPEELLWLENEAPGWARSQLKPSDHGDS